MTLFHDPFAPLFELSRQFAGGGERPVPHQAGGQEGQGEVWQRLERGFGKFERMLRLPSGLDPDTITASLGDGVLTLRIPKPQERKPRRIEIEATANGQRELAGASA